MLLLRNHDGILVEVYPPKVIPRGKEMLGTRTAHRIDIGIVNTREDTLYRPPESTGPCVPLLILQP